MWRAIRYFLIILIFSFAVKAMDCQLAKALHHDKLASNSEFWEKLSQIKSTDERAIRNLINEYAPEALTATGVMAHVAASSTKEVFSINAKAEKAKSKLTKINQRHFDELIQVLTEKGPQGLRDQPGKWNYEVLKEAKGTHSVRLDKGVRVQFTIEEGVVRINDIGNHIGH